ncbi:hypothetical protein BgiMline_033168, partial [Biomphalaria glabrata]
MVPGQVCMASLSRDTTKGHGAWASMYGLPQSRYDQGSWCLGKYVWPPSVETRPRVVVPGQVCMASLSRDTTKGHGAWASMYGLPQSRHDQGSWCLGKYVWPPSVETRPRVMVPGQVCMASLSRDTTKGYGAWESMYGLVQSRHDQGSWCLGKYVWPPSVETRPRVMVPGQVCMASLSRDTTKGHGAWASMYGLVQSRHDQGSWCLGKYVWPPSVETRPRVMVPGQVCMASLSRDTNKGHGAWASMYGLPQSRHDQGSWCLG